MDHSEPTGKEAQILKALISTIEEYMPKAGDRYEHRMMSAPLETLEVLEEFGLAGDDGWCIVPTEKWEDLRDE